MGWSGAGWGGAGWGGGFKEEKTQKSSSKNLLLSDLLEGIHFQPHPPHSGSKADAFFLPTVKKFFNLRVS